MKYLFSAIIYLTTIICFAQQNNTLEFFGNDPLINKKGKLVIPNSYIRNISFNQGLAEVVVKDSSNGIEVVKRGLINKKGRFVVEPDQYNEFKIISPNRVLISKNHKWGMLSVGENTYASLDPIYKRIDVAGENAFRVKHFNEWELKDYSLSSINEFKYDTLFVYPDSVLMYKLNSREGFINFRGNEVDAPSAYCGGSHVTYVDIEPYGIIKNGNKYGWVNSIGDTEISAKYDSISGPYEEIFVVYRKGQIGIVNVHGEIYMELNNRFEKLFPFVEERAMFVKKGKYGFIDKRGNVRVAPQYTHIRNFREGAAAVVINGKWGFIDKDENIIVQPYYSEVIDFKNGIARAKLDNKWYFVAKNGVTIKQAYDDIQETNFGKWLLIRNNKKGLADINGKELLAPRYDSIEDLKYGKVIVTKMGLYGILDYNENFVYPISMDFITYNKEYKLFLFMKKGKEEIIEISENKR